MTLIVGGVKQHFDDQSHYQAIRFAVRASAPGAKRNAVEVRLANGTTIGTALADMQVPEGLCHLVLLNGIFVPPGQRRSTAIAEGDVVSVWPPVAGG